LSLGEVGGHFLLDQKSDDFLVITLAYVVMYVISCHQLLFCLICGGAPHQIQRHFCLIPTKMPVFFSVALGVHLHPPPASPGYACGYSGQLRFVAAKIHEKNLRSVASKQLTTFIKH